MGVRTFEQAFNAVFHNKESFADFCSFDRSQQVEELLYKERRIYRTSKKLKSYLRFIDKVVLRRLAKNHDVVHSYIKEKSALTAVKKHAGNRYFFLTDIKSFFSNIREEDVRRILNRDKHLVPISDLGSYVDSIAHMTTWGGVVPVGFPTSPQLSNGFLFEFDNALHNLCAGQKLVYTRYSDDIIISGNLKEFLVDLRDVVQILLHKHASENFFLNTEKTRITHIGNKVKILGLVITPDGRVTVDSKYKVILESLLHFYTTDRVRYEDFLNKKFEGKEHSVFGLFHYVRATDPAYLEKLQRKYGVFVLRTLMEDRWRGDR